MAQKTLSDMSFAELSEEHAAAMQADQAAEYQDGMGAWQRAKDAARQRLKAVRAEIDARLARLEAGGGVAVEEHGHGG